MLLSVCAVPMHPLESTLVESPTESGRTPQPVRSFLAGLCDRRRPVHALLWCNDVPSFVCCCCCCPRRVDTTGQYSITAGSTADWWLSTRRSLRGAGQYRVVGLVFTEDNSHVRASVNCLLTTYSIHGVLYIYILHGYPQRSQHLSPDDAVRTRSNGPA